MSGELIWTEAQQAIDNNEVACCETGEPHILRDRSVLEQALNRPVNWCSARKLP